jgi:hypothetical protein
MDTKSRNLKRELDRIPNAIKVASVGPNAEVEVLKLMVRREVLPALIHEAHIDEAAAATRQVHA